jgi:uncharacterized protein (DUF1778 family)
MEPPEHPRPHRPDAPARDDERQQALASPSTIALDEKEATRFLKALERPCDHAVARLEGLRRQTR